MECLTSIIRTAGLLFLGLALLGVAWICTNLPGLKAQAAGWIGIAFFGLCLLALVYQLFRSGPAVILGREGIEVARPPFGLIVWDDIDSIFILKAGAARLLCIEVRETEPYLARLTSWQRVIQRANRGFGFPAITVNFAGLTPGLDEVWQYIKERFPEKIVE